MVEVKKCVHCQKLVWTDEASWTQLGISCTGCAYPEIVAPYRPKEVSP